VMSGGLTISGGEPFLQDRFVTKLFAAAQQMKVHTAVNTNGFYGERLSDAELDTIDLVLLDMKTWDPERHKRLTGMDPGKTRAFAERLAARRRPIWLRFVLVPGLTDDLGDVREIARFAARLGNVQRVDVLPFHQLGRFKYERLGIPYALKDQAPPSQELVERVCNVYREAGLVAY
jgi:pyruvate formate lyase activating enzyme